MARIASSNLTPKRTAVARGLHEHASSIASFFAARAIPQRIDVGGRLGRAARQGDEVLLLLSGSVSATLSEPGGNELLVDLVEAPAVLNIEAFGSDRSLEYAAIVEPVQWVATSKMQFLAFGRDAPAAFECLVESVARQMQRRQELLYSIAFESVMARLARLIGRYAELFAQPDAEGLRIPFALSHPALAQSLGVSTRSIDRCMKVMRATKRLRRRNGQIIIHDLEALLSLAEDVEPPH